MTRSRSSTRPIIQTGIDFGTSNSAVGISTNGSISLVPLELGETSIPTALFFNAEDHRTHFGREAIAEYTDGVHGRLMRSIKSILGSTLVDDTTVVAGHSLTYENIISLFLKHLREVALALQKLSVEWIKEAPEKYAALADPHAAFIKFIEVSEVGAESPSS